MQPLLFFGERARGVSTALIVSQMMNTMFILGSKTPKKTSCFKQSQICLIHVQSDAFFTWCQKHWHPLRRNFWYSNLVIENVLYSLTRDADCSGYISYSLSSSFITILWTKIFNMFLSSCIARHPWVIINAFSSSSGFSCPLLYCWALSPNVAPISDLPILTTLMFMVSKEKCPYGLIGRNKWVSVRDG